jgi:hypothetical protein
MEAYGAVYAPQELTEEQVWEEVENWVNSLLEEGYDLSEYTWEEMYEAYIEEAGMNVFSTPAVKKAQTDAAMNVFSPKPKGGMDVFSTPAVRKAQADKSMRSAQDLFGIKQKPVVTPVPGSGSSDAGSGGSNRGDGGSRPPRPPSAKPPAAPKVAPKPTDGAERRTPTSAELKAAQQARTSAILDLKTKPEAEKAAVQAGINAGKSKPTPRPDARAIAAKASVANVTAPSSSSSTPAAAPKPPTRRLSAADQRQGIRASYEYDAYDLVLEYLLSEGHVETVEEAHYVMMEMDAEMVQDIVEGGFNNSGRYDVGGGRTVGPVSGAVRALVSGNLPKQRTYVPPSPQQGSNRPPAVPASKGDSGKLTDFGAGGGKAKMKTGMSAGQVERQGRRNKGDYSG